MRNKLAVTCTMLFGIAGMSASAREEPAPAPRSVLELRQYKIVTGKRDIFIPLFEREFVESQEALGMRLIGQYRERDDPNRFVWLREFPDMAKRGEQLPAFYYGPVWKAHRDEANPLLDDNDNVLLLRPAAAGDDFAVTSPRAAVGAPPPPHGLIIAHILYLWKDPTAGFATFFDAKVKPVLEKAGLPVLGVFVPEAEPNNFPRLSVRQGEKLLVWFTRVENQAAYDSAWKRVLQTPSWRDSVAASFSDAQERPAQVLHLDPTQRSALR